MKRIQSNDPCILTVSGRYVYPLDLNPDDICIEDVAHALSNLARFSGHTVPGFYSVAQHSVLVSRLLRETEYEMWGLLHDATEAYLVDIPRPLKKHPTFGQTYRGAERRAMRSVATAFGLSWPEPDVVHWADNVLLSTERRDLMHPNGVWEETRETPMEEQITPWSPKRARQEFLIRYQVLCKRETRG